MTAQPVIFSLLDTPAFGGAEQYLLSHLIHLSREGYPIVVATNNAQVKKIYQQEIKRQKVPQFKVITAPYLLDAIGNWKGLVKFFLALPAAWWWCYQTLRELSATYPQVICYWPGFSDRLVFSPLAKWFACQLVWIEIGPLEPTFAKNHGFPGWLYHRVKHLPDQFVTTSKYTRQSMVTTGDLPQSAITLLYPGVKLHTAIEMNTLQSNGRRWRKQHHLTEKTLIAWVGRLALENELELLLEAFHGLQEQLGPAKLHLLIIGDGPEKNHYQKLAAELGITDHLTWTGFVDETTKFSLLAASDMFVFTRAWNIDGFGMTTIEALSVGLPVITSRFGPQLEIVRHRQTGLLFTPHNSTSLAKQLALLIQDKKLRHQLALQAPTTLAPFAATTSLASLSYLMASLTRQALRRSSSR